MIREQVAALARSVESELLHTYRRSTDPDERRALRSYGIDPDRRGLESLAAVEHRIEDDAESYATQHIIRVLQEVA